MLIYSVKVKRGMLGLSFLALLVATVLYIVLLGPRAQATAAQERFPRATDEAGRQVILQQLGLSVEEQPESFCEIVLPEQFDDVYQTYNKLQLQAGFDLTAYQGRRVMRYTYVVIGSTDGQRCNLLFYKGKLIGGDLATPQLDGEMLPLPVQLEAG